MDISDEWLDLNIKGDGHLCWGFNIKKDQNDLQMPTLPKYLELVLFFFQRLESKLTITCILLSKLALC